MSGPFRDSLKESFFLKKSFSFSFGLFGEIMKRSFMLASALATASLFAATAKATPASPDPASMFVISTPAPGVINFQGTGSATFTNTQGATDSVTVGSNSSFGVTVSGSNSSDYTSTASAILDLADTTSLHHATGTASQAFNMMYSAAAANAPDDSRLTDQVSKISSVLTTSTGGGLTEAITQDLAGAFDHQAASKANSVVGISPADPGSSGVEYYDDIDGTTDIDGYNAAVAKKNMLGLTLPLALRRPQLMPMT